MNGFNSEAFDALERAALDPVDYAYKWKERTGGKVIGSFPMNFPSELVHASGALPVVVQESRTSITEGRSLLPEFYCSYTRSLADQAAIGELDVFDGFVLVDHCVQLLGAVDVIRWAMPEKPLHFAQFISSMDDPWSQGEVENKVSAMRQEVEAALETTIDDTQLQDSIHAFNENRALLRKFYSMRQGGELHIPASQLQTLVKSSMVMEIREHSDLLQQLLLDVKKETPPEEQLVRLHLSGHFCAPPRQELLDLLEECDILVVNDDLYHGNRYISTDVPEDSDPFRALARWYLDRNVSVPCATRVQRDVDWEKYLVSELEKTGAEGVITLMAKFCEPLMLYYPELRSSLNERDIPELIIETEHEGLAAESIRTTVETFVERIRRQRSKQFSSV